MFVAAHRGSRLHAPENSLHALLAGYTAGGEAIEFDLQLTLDGHVVLSHDGTIDRMTGLDGDLAVGGMTLAQLREHDYSPGLARFRRWPDFAYHRSESDKVGICTLEEAIDALPTDVPKLIELKTESTIGTARVEELVETTVQILRSRGVIAGCVTYSMDPEVVRLIRLTAADLRVCAFDYKLDIGEQLGLMRSLDADGLVIQHKDVFQESGELTAFGAQLQEEHDRRSLRVGAVLYPFRELGVPWVISPEELQVMREHSFVWSCATDSMIAVEGYARELSLIHI